MKQYLFVIVGCLLVVLSSSCSRVQHLASAESSNIHVSDQFHPHKDTAILLFVEPYRQQFESKMNETIGHSAEKLERMQTDGPLNRVVADIIHKYAETAIEGNIDFAVQNYYGLRINSLPKGPLTLGLLYELMPFENYLVILEVPGSVVKELCDLIASNSGWPVSHGLSFGIKDGNAQSIMVGGRALENDRIYRIATNDYLANGGDQALFFRAFPNKNTGLLIRNILIDHIRTLELKGEYLKDNHPANRIFLDAP